MGRVGQCCGGQEKNKNLVFKAGSAKSLYTLTRLPSNVTCIMHRFFFFFPSAYVRAARYTIYLFGARYRFAPLAFRIKPANKYRPSLLSLVHESGFCIRGRVGPLHKPCQNLKPSAYTPFIDILYMPVSCLSTDTSRWKPYKKWNSALLHPFHRACC